MVDIMTQHPWPLGIEPGQNVTVDLFRPEDAAGVVALFRSVYGEDYPVKVYYDPEALARDNAEGDLVSSVARTPRGEIVGHSALFRSAPSPRLYELGAGVVLSSYRNTAKLLTRMMTHGPRVAAERFGLEVVFGDPLCSHVYSQRICHHLGWITHAMEIDLMPAGLYGQQARQGERVSATMDFLAVAPKPHEVFLPPAYLEPLRFLYQGLDDERRLTIAERDIPAGLATRLETRMFPFAQLARLAVWEAGNDLAEALDREEAAAAGGGARVMQVWLRLSCPWVGRAVDLLRGRGYFLGGLLPRWFDEDGLLMQRMEHEPHWHNINLEYDRAKSVLALVREDWGKVHKT